MLSVRLFGHVSASFGLADGAAATRRSLELAGCSVDCCDLRLSTHPSQEDDPTLSVPKSTDVGVQPSGRIEPGTPVQIDLVHTNPNVLAAIPGLLKVSSLTAPLRVGYWAWELESFPEGWDQHFHHYDEIWCPSAYCAQSLAQRSPVPVIALPHLPDWPRLDRLLMQRSEHHQEPENTGAPFRFLTLFDFWSTPERKNPAGAIAAFLRAFPAERHEPPVELWIKTSSADQFPRQRAALEALGGGDRRIRWIDGLLSREALDALFCSADALLSLHRAEGFGLNLADAMAIGLPVVATGYSANLEFMPPGSAALVPWQPKTIEQRCGDYPQGAIWAEPDLDEAAAALRLLVLNPNHRLSLAARGIAAARERLAADRLVGIVRQRLAQLLLQPSRRELLQDLAPQDPARLLCH